jgi:hypothetical protein
VRPDTARLLHVTAGQTIPVRFVDGLTEQIQVREVLADDMARGDFVLPRDLVRTHDRAALTDTIFIPKGQAPQSVSAGAALHDAEAYTLQDYNTDAKLTNSLAMMLIAVAVGYSGLAVANSMAMAAYVSTTYSSGPPRSQTIAYRRVTPTNQRGRAPSADERAMCAAPSGKPSVLQLVSNILPTLDWFSGGTRPATDAFTR